MATLRITKDDFLACCGSTKFASMMGKFSGNSFTLSQAVELSRDIWFNKIDIPGWLEAFAAHPQIGSNLSPDHDKKEWSKGEQSAAMDTATASTLKELAKWNQFYKDKFGFIFLICATGKSTPEILNELKTRCKNRPIIEIEIAATEQQKITELRLAKLFAEKTHNMSHVTSESDEPLETEGMMAAGLRLKQIGGHLTTNTSQQKCSRSRPPITTHVLDVSRGKPAAGIEILLEVLRGPISATASLFSFEDSIGWKQLGSSSTDNDGRCGSLMPMVDDIPAGVYKLTFNTGRYYSMGGTATPDSEIERGFYPYVSIAFEIKPYQKTEHFHVPLLLSPFSFSTYRGS